MLVLRRGTCTGASIAANVVCGGQCRFHNIFSYAPTLQTILYNPLFATLPAHLLCRPLHHKPLIRTWARTWPAAICAICHKLYINLTSKHAPGKLAGNSGIFRTTPTAELMKRTYGANLLAGKHIFALSDHFLCIRCTRMSYHCIYGE